MAVLNFYPTDPRAQAAFQFDHAQAHVSLTWAQLTPSTGTLANYLLDPMLRVSIGAPDLWSLDHQQAHDDAAAYYGVEQSLPLPDETTGDPFWTFVNDQEHQALATAALNQG